jgi:hypothetical protein
MKNKIKSELDRKHGVNENILRKPKMFGIFGSIHAGNEKSGSAINFPAYGAVGLKEHGIRAEQTKAEAAAFLLRRHLATR